MLLGQFDGKLSAKNQIAFPKSFREVLGSKLVVTKGLEGYLIVVSEKNWKTLLEGTQNKPFTNKDARETQRYLLGNASLVGIDSRGRFVLAEHLKKHAGIKSDIIFAGIERFVEIWDKGAWEKHQAELSTRVATIADKLTEKDLV
ncbi:MAG: division/cell wall cluster transcriptional repressor MraZ [Candidatus Levyibacteriota bacterium]